jgi:hypothetical protein
MRISVNPEYFDLIPCRSIEYAQAINIDQIKGMAITAVVYKESDESLHIHLNTHVLEMIHHQDCCETVYLADVVGEFEDLIGYPLIEVSESTVDIGNDDISSTASYYNFKTLKASVQLRWVGESNGYYSETIGCYLYPTGD